MIRKIISTIILITLISCSGNTKKEYASVEEMVQDAKTKVTFISADELKSQIDSHESFYLIDCREQDEFDIACIQNAISIPRGTLEGTVSEKAPKHRNPVYIYCSNGDRSTLAALVLPLLKYSDVKVLEGGFEAFQTKYPALVEQAPKRGGTEVKVAKPSGGCGG
jgi:rhodanese-related sulfurtransferase